MNPQWKSLLNMVRTGFEENLKVAIHAVEKNRKKEIKMLRDRLEKLRRSEMKTVKSRLEDVRKRLDQYEALRPYLSVVAAAAESALGTHRTPRSAPRKRAKTKTTATHRKRTPARAKRAG